MSSDLKNIFITGSTKGLQKNKKPFLLPDQAWQVMENAYCFRERILKRGGKSLIGRLQRDFSTISQGNTNSAVISQTITDILSTYRTAAPDSEIVPGSLTISIGAPDTSTFIDLGNGNFSVTGLGKSLGSYVNYTTGEVVLAFNSPTTGGAAITANYSYYPVLSAMGISTQDQAQVNQEQTIIFDQVYSYIYHNGSFEEYLPGGNTTWASTNSDFFYTNNYYGSTQASRILFETNFIPNSSNPMRYTDGTANWANFAPQVDNAMTPNVVLTARIIIPYWGRLLLFNTWEGSADYSTIAPVQYFARVRWSWAGNVLDADAFRADLFGTSNNGAAGFADAPTSEMIIGVEFVENTLVVSFEKSKWQLRYQGDYGQPFIWERVSADFGSDSTFSTVILENQVLDVGDKAIVSTTSTETKRIDLEIPDEVYTIQQENNGEDRVQGIRDYYRELIYWCFPNVLKQPGSSTSLIFPNYVFVYNYRNNSWAIFRDGVTCFGYMRYASSNVEYVTWDSLTVTWDDDDITWDDAEESNPNTETVICGNQQGYIHAYNVQTPNDPELSIRGISLVSGVFELTIPNHNLLPYEIIYLTGMQFLDTTTFRPVQTTLNNSYYRVQIVDADTIYLAKWNTSTSTYETNFPYTFTQGISTLPFSGVTYIGGGQIAIIPRLNIVTKDINLFQSKGLSTKMSYIDFLMKPSTNGAAIAIYIWRNAYVGNSSVDSTKSLQKNQPIGSQYLSLLPVYQFYDNTSDYAWFRFYGPISVQYFNINITYDDTLMNLKTTENDDTTLYAINAFCKQGGRIVI